MGAAVRRPVPGRLTFADRDRAAVGAGSLEHSERHQVDVRDRECACLVRRLCELGRRLEAAEEVRLLEDDRSRIDGSGGELVRIDRAVPMGHLDDVEAEPRGVRLDDLPHLRAHGLGENDLGALRDVPGHEACVRGDRAAVVAGRVRDVHARQLADHRLVLEDRLQRALAHLGLVRRVRGQELSAREDDVRDRRDVVVVDSRAEERELRARVHVARCKLLEVPRELGLTERRRDVELAVEADSGRNLLEELVHGGDADRREHLRAVGVGEAEVAGAHYVTARRRARGTRLRP